MFEQDEVLPTSNVPVGCGEMKGKVIHVQPRETEATLNDLVRLELESYHKALSSYVRGAERDPELTFEKHLRKILAAGLSHPAAQ